MRNKKEYIKPQVEIIEVCSEGVMLEPVSWEVEGDGDKGNIHEGNPPGAKEDPKSNYNIWEDDEY